jgi:hypothetical protein
MFSDESVGIAHLGQVKCDLPCSSELWEANEEEWQKLPRPRPGWFPSTMSSILSGTPVYADLGTFSVLALMGGMLVHIATHERLSWHKAPCADQEWTTSISNTLCGWEETWKHHPQANPNLYNDTDGPLMADCVPLLNTAYFHIYAPRLLLRMKEMLVTAIQNPLDITREQFHAVLMSQSEGERNMLFRAAAHAAHSLHVRARLGYNLVAHSASLDNAPYYSFTGFESCIVSSLKVLT